MHIGLYPISAKPYHIGHHKVIHTASQECDQVILIVSLLDRDNVLGMDMAEIWRDHINPSLPKNVTTIFLEESPVSHVIKILKLREADQSSNYQFKIYSDDLDITRNYNDEVLSKICPTLLMNSVVERRGISRDSTCKISGKEMREFIRNGDFESFSNYLPKEFNSRAIFEKLATLHKH